MSTEPNIPNEHTECESYRGWTITVFQQSYYAFKGDKKLGPSATQAEVRKNCDYWTVDPEVALIMRSRNAS